MHTALVSPCLGRILPAYFYNYIKLPWRFSLKPLGGSFWACARFTSHAASSLFCSEFLTEGLHTCPPQHRTHAHRPNSAGGLWAGTSEGNPSAWFSDPTKTLGLSVPAASRINFRMPPFGSTLERFPWKYQQTRVSTVASCGAHGCRPSTVGVLVIADK